MLARIAAGALLAFAAAPAAAEPARVISVYDGDTFTAEVEVWPAPPVTVRTAVRVRGIDAPEIRGKCPAEKALARRARDRARTLLGDHVELADIGRDKYAGRIDAEVILADGSRLADLLISAGLARPYDGSKRRGWCGPQK